VESHTLTWTDSFSNWWRRLTIVSLKTTVSLLAWDFVGEHSTQHSSNSDRRLSENWRNFETSSENTDSDEDTELGGVGVTDDIIVVEDDVAS
jgi:hypothetical protein